MQDKLTKAYLTELHKNTEPWLFHKIFTKYLTELPDDVPEKLTRSKDQNKALHAYLTNLAEELDRNGYTMQDVVKSIKRAEIRPTMVALKEVVWRPLQAIVAGTSTTTLLTTSEINRIVDTITKWTAENFDGMYVPFVPEKTDPLQLNGYRYPEYKGEVTFDIT